MADENKLKHVHRAIKQKFKDKSLVFGHGFLDAKIVFVGEMLGQEGEKDNKPITGNSEKLFGQLLKSIGIEKKKVYFTNVVKYFPDGAIAPTPKEIKSHATFLKEEIKTIGPTLVVTFGNLALNGIGLRQPLDNVHGRIFSLGDHELFPTFHPEQALRDSSVKTLLEADFVKLKRLLEEKKKQSSEV